MTELDLYKFIEEYNPEYHWCGNEILLMPAIWKFEKLAKMLPANLFDEEGIEIIWKGDYVVIEMTDICEYFGIYYPERVFSEKDSC